MATAECGPGSPQRTQVSKLGAHPASERARKRYESSVSEGSCSASESERSAPIKRMYCCGDDSSEVSFSAASTIALAAVKVA